MFGCTDQTGQGATERFVRAAVCRDRQHDIADAFGFVLDGVLKLMHQPPPVLRRDVLHGADSRSKQLRRLLWQFLKNSKTGLPSANLSAKLEWHPTLKSRIPGLLQTIEDSCALTRLSSWQHNLTKKKLGNGPLWQVDVGGKAASGIRIGTVHQAKGESIDAVLYVARKNDVTSLLNGPTTEDGRIGYVAVTRARDLLLLAVPDSIDADKMTALEMVGFQKWT